MTRTRLLLTACSIVVALDAAACRKRGKSGSTTTTSAELEAGAEQKPAEAPLPAQPDPSRLAPVITWSDDGFASPAAVIHDEAADIYLVSNVDGDPVAADNKGFISKLLPDGTQLLLKWITAGRNNVKLNAPKGMALRDDYLYVADIDTVRIFDRNTGAPAGDVVIRGATFLNAVVLAPDGRILVSDAGLKATPKRDGLEPSYTDAVYAIDKNRKVTPLARTRLGGPNGLLPVGDKVWVVSFGSGEIYSLDKGWPVEVHALPQGSLYGIVPLGDEMLVASWAGNAIYRGKPLGDWKVAIPDVKSPANIGYDRKRGRVLVPLLTEDEVLEYDLK